MISPSCKTCPTYSAYCEYDPLTDTLYPTILPITLSSKENAMEENKYLPLNSTETSQLQFLHSLYRCLKDDESLKPRFSSIGLWWRYKGLLKQLHNMYDAAWQTIDPEKRRRMNFLWSNQELRIVNAGQPVDQRRPDTRRRTAENHCRTKGNVYDP